MKPRRRILLWVSALMVLLIAAAWERSCFRMDRLEWVPATRPERDGSVPDGQMGAWTYSAIYWALVSGEGILVLSRSEYLSVDASAEALRQRWDRSEHGPHWRSDLVKFSPVGQSRFWSGPTEWEFAGLGVFSVSRKGTTSRIVHAPYWLLLSLAAAPIMVAFARDRMRRRRATRNQCPACGYPAGVSDRCTDCGASAATAP